MYYTPPTFCYVAVRPYFFFFFCDCSISATTIPARWKVVIVNPDRTFGGSSDWFYFSGWTHTSPISSAPSDLTFFFFFCVPVQYRKLVIFNPDRTKQLDQKEFDCMRKPDFSKKSDASWFFLVLDHKNDP